MKKLTTLICFVIAHHFVIGQQGSGTLNLKNLAVPQSPGLALLDASSSNITTSNTPKEFALGVLNAFQTGNGWPQNYSTEFTPYWLLNHTGRDIYAFTGLKKPAPGNKTSGAPDPFAGLKFTTIGISFISKDLIKDISDKEEKIGAISFSSNVIRLFSKARNARLAAKMDEWHDSTLALISTGIQEITASEDDSVKRKALIQKFLNTPRPASTVIRDSIDAIVNIKPAFNWTIAGAYSIYGIGDTSWQSGRTGVWTTISANILLNPKGEFPTDYFSLLASARYMQDRFAQDDKKNLVKSNAFDVGGKVELQFDRFSLAFEAITRHFSMGDIKNQKRLVGIVNYRINDNLYINGAFGENFNPFDKLITLVGINWGFGSEKVNIPE